MRLTLHTIALILCSVLLTITVTCAPFSEAEIVKCIIRIQFLKSDKEPYSKLYVMAITDEGICFKGETTKDGMITIPLNVTCSPTEWFIPIKVKLILNGSYYIKPLSQTLVELTLKRQEGYSRLTYFSPTITWEEFSKTHSVYVLREYLKCENLTQVRDIKLLVYDGALLDLYYDRDVETLLRELNVNIWVLEDYVKPISGGLRLVIPKRQVLTVNILLRKSSFSKTFPIIVRCEDVIGNGIDITEKIVKEVPKLFELYYSLTSMKLSKYGIWAKIYERKLELMKMLLTRSQKMLTEKHYSDSIYSLNLVYENYEFLRDELEVLWKKCYFYAPLIIGLLVSFSIAVSELIGRHKKSIVLLTFLVSSLIMYLASLELRVVVLDFISVAFVRSSMLYYMKPLIPLGCLFPIPIILLFKLVDVEHALLNLKRRKLRLLLMLMTICSVSVALMIHTSSFFGFVPEIKILGEVSTYASFISIRKLKIERGHTAYPFDNNAIVEMSYREAIGILRILNVTGYFDAEKLIRIKGNTIKAFFTNLSHLLENNEFRESLIEFSELRENSIIISNELSKSLNLSLGSRVEVNGTQYIVVGIFNSKIATNVRDMDFLPLIVKKYDIILPYQGASEGCRVIKIMIFSDNVEKVIDDLLTIGTIMRAEYVGKGGGYITKGTSYVVRYALDKTLVERAYVDLGFIIKSDIISQVIISAIALLLISINAMGTIIERKKELQTLSCIGANPLNLSCYVLTEAITLGLIGGVVAFVVGKSLNYFIRTTYHEIMLFPGVEMFDILIVVIFSIGFTLLGYVVPVRESIKTVVPSHLLAREKGKILKISKNKVALIPFLRVRRDEIPNFVTYLLEEMPSKLKIVTIGDKKLLKERDKYSIIISGTYVGLVISGVYRIKIKVEVPLTDISIPRVSIEFIPKVPPSKSDLMRLITRIRETILEYSV